MNIKITKVYGTAKLEFTIDAPDTKSALFKAATFTGNDICGKCNGTDVCLDGNKAQTDQGTFYYVRRRCMNTQCNATSTLGEMKGGEGYFWKGWEIYVKNSQPQPQQQVPIEPVQPQLANQK